MSGGWQHAVEMNASYTGTAQDLQRPGRLQFPGAHFAGIAHDVLGDRGQVRGVQLGLVAHHQPAFDPAEIADWRWMAVADLQRELREHPERYAPWLPGAIRIALEAVSTS